MNGEEVEYWYEDGRLLYEKRGTDKEFYYSYDGYGNLSCIRYFLSGAQYTYYFLTNARGDVELIYGGSGVVLARYTYDSWGNTISIKDGSGEEITDPTNIALLNPIRYRGYYYDSETGLYYLQSRYYDPTTCRFVNADDLSMAVCTPGSITYSKNTYAYCENSPIMHCDLNGKWTISISLFIGFNVFFGGSYTVGVVFDDKGNIDWQISASDVSLGIFSAGTGISIQCTNRDTVYDLYGSSTAIGLSKNAYKWLSIGGDLIYFSDISDMSNSQQSAQGLQICIGLGVGMDTHIIKSTTKKWT